MLASNRLDQISCEWSGFPHSVSTQQHLPGSPSLTDDVFLEKNQLAEIDNQAFSAILNSPSFATDLLASGWLFQFRGADHTLHHYNQSHQNIVLYIPNYPYPVFLFNLGPLDTISSQITVTESRRMLSLAIGTNHDEIPKLDIGTLFNTEVIQTDLQSNASVTYPTIYFDIPLPSSYTGHLEKHLTNNRTPGGGLESIETLRRCYSNQRSIPLLTDIEKAFKLSQAVQYFHGKKRDAIVTQVLKENYVIAPHSLYVYSMIYICLFGYTFTNQTTQTNALDLIIRQSLIQCSSLNDIVLLRASLKQLEYPINAQGNWVKVTKREFYSVKNKILEYIDDKYTRMFYKLYNGQESDLFDFSGFLLMSNLIRSSRLVVDDENQVLRALRQYLITNADVICAEKTRLNIPDVYADMAQLPNVVKEIYKHQGSSPYKKIELFDHINGRIFFRVSRYSQLVEDAICYMIAGIRWHSFKENSLSLLQFLYEDLNYLGIITEFSFDTFCYVIESHRDPTTLLNRTQRSAGVGKGHNKMFTQHVTSFKAMSGNDVCYPKEICLSYHPHDSRHYFQTFHLSSVGKSMRMNELSLFTRYHVLRMRENPVINRFLTLDLRVFNGYIIRNLDMISANKYDKILYKAHNQHLEMLVSSDRVRKYHAALLQQCESKNMYGYSHQNIMPNNFNQLIDSLKKQIFAKLHPEIALKKVKSLRVEQERVRRETIKAEKRARRDSRRGSIASVASQDLTSQSTSSTVSTPGMCTNSSPFAFNQALHSVFNSANNCSGMIIAAEQMALSSQSNKQFCNVQSFNNTSSMSITNYSTESTKSKKGTKRGRVESPSNGPTLFQFVVEDGKNPTKTKKVKSIQQQQIEELREVADILSLSNNDAQTPRVIPTQPIQPPTAIFKPRPSPLFSNKWTNFLAYDVASYFGCSSPTVTVPDSVLDEIHLPLFVFVPHDATPEKHLSELDMSNVLGDLSFEAHFRVLNYENLIAPIPEVTINCGPQRPEIVPSHAIIQGDDRVDPYDFDWSYTNVDSILFKAQQYDFHKQQHLSMQLCEFNQAPPPQQVIQEESFNFLDDPILDIMNVLGEEDPFCSFADEQQHP